MSAPVSPLRYPGGKARIAPVLEAVWGQAPPEAEVWIEPFAGGAGVALALLESGAASEAWLVEANPAVAALWEWLLSDPDGAARRVELWEPTLDGFYAARDEVSRALEGDSEVRDDLAWSAFVVNRCSFSGIVDGRVGPLGGRSQTGRYRVSSRWNGPALAERIRRVGSLSGRVRLVAGDALTLLEDLPDSGLDGEAFVFADPPYVKAGPALYPWSFREEDHARLASALRAISSPWVATYDDDPVVRRLYDGCRIERVAMPHTAGKPHVGVELLIRPPSPESGPGTM